MMYIVNLKALFLIAILVPIASYSQFNFESDSIAPVETVLGFPDRDSIRFEFRLWNASTIVSIFAQLTLDQSNEWNYRTGFLNHNAEITYFDNSKNIDINKLWSVLDSLGVRELKSQDEVDLSVNRKGVVYKLKREEFEKFSGVGGVLNKVELFYENNYRTYHYLNAIKISDSFRKSKEKWIAEEHHAMAQIIKTVNATFDSVNNFKKYLEKVGKKSRNR